MFLNVRNQKMLGIFSGFFFGNFSGTDNTNNYRNKNTKIYKDIS